jgi:hypothetical protein
MSFGTGPKWLGSRKFNPRQWCDLAPQMFEWEDISTLWRAATLARFGEISATFSDLVMTSDGSWPYRSSPQLEFAQSLTPWLKVGRLLIHAVAAPIVGVVAPT